MFPRVTHPCASLSEDSDRLACVRPAASVRSEPGSNSQVDLSNPLQNLLRLALGYVLDCPILPGNRPRIPSVSSRCQTANRTNRRASKALNSLTVSSFEAPRQREAGLYRCRSTVSTAFFRFVIFLFAAEASHIILTKPSSVPSRLNQNRLTR